VGGGGVLGYVRDYRLLSNNMLHEISYATTYDKQETSLHRAVLTPFYHMDISLTLDYLIYLQREKSN
jgi:hypothetical protein